MPRLYGLRGFILQYLLKKASTYLLYHTLSRALIEVDKTGWDVLQTLSTDTPTDAGALTFFKELQTQGFIVEKSIYWVQKREVASQPDLIKGPWRH